MGTFVAGQAGLRPPSDGGLSLTLLVLWAGAWAWGVGVGLAVIVLLVFPDGHLPSRRWRPVLWLAIGTLLAFVIGLGFGSPDIGDSQVPNPLALGGPIGTALGALAAAFPLLFLAALLAIVSVISRWRRAREIERQQIKWLLYAAMLVGVGLVAQVPLLILVRPPQAASDASNATITATFAAIPVAVGTAILRYRLYEIDRIISRTLGYAVLTAILAAVYVAGFLSLQSVLAPFTANGGPVAVAASTLVVFVLFQPVRRRIQGAIDRRFYRSRYDAAREIENFAARVRDEVEVDRLAGAISMTLERTMQPASASIWLRSGGRGRP